MEWPFKDPVTAPIRWQQPGKLQQAVCALNQHPIYSMVSSLARIHGSRNQGVEKAIVLPTITPSKSLGKFWLPIAITLSFVGLEVFVPEVGVLPPRVTLNTAFTVDFPLATSSF